MLDAVKKAGVVHMVCHNYRRIPAIAQAKKMIAAGDLGPDFSLSRALSCRTGSSTPNFRSSGVCRARSRAAARTATSTRTSSTSAAISSASSAKSAVISRPSSRSGPCPDRRPKRARVTVDDAVITLGKFKNGALACLEASRFAAGRKNHIQIEINGSKGSLVFDFEDMNRLKYFNRDDAADRQGYRDIIVTEGVHPYVGAWWPPGHIIGYEHTFVHTIFDFIQAVVKGKSVQPTFADGLQNQKVLAAVEKSSKQRRWVKL